MSTNKITQDKLLKKIQNSLKFAGFNVRRDLCNLIINEFIKKNINLSEQRTYVESVKNLSNCLERLCTAEQSIEKEQVVKAVEICLNSGYDNDETAFSVFGAFDFPKFSYEADRKQYYLCKNKSQLLSDASTKAQVFIERYQAVLLKTRRIFAKTGLELQTVDFLLTSSGICLEKTLILGSIAEETEGKYSLEDPTGTVQLELSHAKYEGGFFAENTFVLANGLYEDKILTVSTMILPPGEEYEDSKPFYCGINYFGGSSRTQLRESKNLEKHSATKPDDFMLFFSDVWLDHALIFDKFEILFNGYQENPPIAFVFMGNFICESSGSERMETLKKCFKKLGDLLSKFPTLREESQFVFIPGLTDPASPHIVPRFPLPSYIAEDFRKNVPNAIFTTNPCRIQYCHREITVFRCDILPKMLQGTLSKPKKEKIGEFVARTIVSQGHLVPLSLNSQPVHWDFDYTLRLNPLPDLVVVGDKSPYFEENYKGCTVVNPSSFCDHEFHFISYTPHTNSVEVCVL